MGFASINGNYLNEAAICEKKWSNIVDEQGEKINLVEGIKNPEIRKMTSVMLENQALANQMYSEQSTDSADVAQFKRISIPLVSRIYPQLIANKIVSVQPLLGPTGLVFYLRFRYASNKGATRGNTQAGFPTDDALSLQQLSTGIPNLDIWYSHQYVSNETLTNAGGSTSATYQIERQPILAGTLVGSVYEGVTLVNTFSVASTGVFTFTTVGSPTNYATAGSVNVTSGLLTLTWNNAPTANSVVISYEQNLEGQPDLPEINLAVESEDIVATTRKLKASWTQEAAQDLRSQHNIDAEAELTAVLAQEINLEIDREILTDLRTNAGTTLTWDLTSASFGTTGTTLKEKYETLYVSLVKASNLIHKKTLRGQANWIVCSPEVAAIFETATAGFAPTMSETFTSSLGIQYVGTINGKWQMFKDPLFPTDQVLLGYKGDSYLDSGYYYCPYVPLTQTPTVIDPHTFQPRKGLMVRYGKKLLNNGARYYAKINLLNYTI